MTHTKPESVRLALDLTFVTDGLASAIRLARAAAGTKDVVVMGGGDVVRQCIDEGLADEFVLRQRDVRVSPYATHVTYDVVV